MDFRLFSALLRLPKSEKDIYFQEGHGVWIWEERTLAIIFLFLETNNIYILYILKDEVACENTLKAGGRTGKLIQLWGT